MGVHVVNVVLLIRLIGKICPFSLVTCQFRAVLVYSSSLVLSSFILPIDICPAELYHYLQYFLYFFITKILCLVLKLLQYSVTN